LRVCCRGHLFVLLVPDGVRDLAIDDDIG
jgi:hypothetical protein